MALFPEVPYELRDPEDNAVLQSMENSYIRYSPINMAYWEMADRDTRAEAGDPNLWQELFGNLSANRIRLLSLNHIRPTVNVIQGQQRQNRMSIIAVPIENADQETADQFSKILMWVSSRARIPDKTADAFHGSVVTGLSMLQLSVDYRSDPISGDINVEYCPYNSFFIDPFFRNKDLSDCNMIWKRTFITKAEALSYLPDKKDVIMSLETGYKKDGKFNFMPESFDAANYNLMAYDEYYYRSFRTQKLLADKETGETMEWTSNDEEGLDRFLKTYPQLSMIEQEIPTVRLSIVLQGKVMYDGPNPIGIDDYPFVPIFCYFNPQLQDYNLRIQGVVRALVDPQYMYNRRKTLELKFLESTVTSGWIYVEGSVINPRDVFKTGEGRPLILKEGSNIGTDIQQIQPPAIPQMTLEVSKAMGMEMPQISGVHEELMGASSDKDVAGFLSALRSRASLVSLQPIFDNLDFATENLGRKLIGVIQSNFMPGKVQRILNEQPQPQFYNKAFGKYDCEVTEGINTVTQKQMNFTQLMQLREAGVAIPDDALLETVTLQNKNDLIRSIQEKQQQASQLEQQRAQIEMQELQARIELSNARAIADKGLGLERVSRIEENRELAVERKAEAFKDRAAGLLDIIKGLQELDSIDINQLRQLIELSKLMQPEETTKPATNLKEKVNSLSS